MNTNRTYHIRTLSKREARDKAIALAMSDVPDNTWVRVKVKEAGISAGLRSVNVTVTRE